MTCRGTSVRHPARLEHRQRHWVLLESLIPGYKSPTIMSRSIIFVALTSALFWCVGKAWSPLHPLRSRQEQEIAVSRRAWIATMGLVGSSSIALISRADESTPIFERSDSQKGFSYIFTPPQGMTSTNKPLKTHLDEINFKGDQRSSYQYGITVDPVRIQSLKDFGTPQEVAARVVLAELKRDGVFDVTLMDDPKEGKEGDYYELNYLSSGKRGKKRFIAKFYVDQQKLYALTAQCKEDDYPELAGEIQAAVDSFNIHHGSTTELRSF